MNGQDALEKWGAYQGAAPKPADFDDFWEKCKKEVESLGLKYQLTEYPLYSNVAEAWDLQFTGVDQATIHCQLVKPKNYKGKLGLLLRFHGYHNSAGDWSEKIGQAAEGFAVLTLNVRGQGGPSEDRSLTKGGTLKGHIIRGIDEGRDNLHFKRVFQDVYQMTRIGMSFEDVDPARVYAYGGSQGGAQALVCAALSPQVRATFVLFPFLSDYRLAYRTNVLMSAYEELAYWFRYRDPRHEREEYVFSQLDYIDIQFLADRIRGKVIWAMALRDDACPPQTQFATYNKLTCEKELVFYPDYIHEDLPGFWDRVRKEIFMDSVNGN